MPNSNLPDHPRRHRRRPRKRRVATYGLLTLLGTGALVLLNQTHPSQASLSEWFTSDLPPIAQQITSPDSEVSPRSQSNSFIANAVEQVGRERAADLGVPVASIAQTIRSLIAGDKISELKDGTDIYDIKDYDHPIRQWLTRYTYHDNDNEGFHIRVDRQTMEVVEAEIQNFEMEEELEASRQVELDLARQLGQHRRLVAAAGADFQHPIIGPQVEQIGHHGDDVGLRDRLAEADRQRPVGIGRAAVHLEVPLRRADVGEEPLHPLGVAGEHFLVEKSRVPTDQHVADVDGKVGDRRNAAAAERNAAGRNGQYKAEVYRSSKRYQLFVESEVDQARQIARWSGKPVFCIETMQMINPGVYPWQNEQTADTDYHRRGTLLARLRRSMRRTSG